jgi:hypothetical protein
MLTVFVLLAGLSGATADEVLFDGAPDPAVKLGAEISHGRVRLRTPPGWREPFYSGATWLASPDGAAVVLVYNIDTRKVLHDAHLQAPLGTSTVKWSVAVTSKIGGEGLPARVQPGSGRIGAAWTEYTHSGGGSPWVLINAEKMNKDEARLWRIYLAQTDGKKSYVLLAALKNAATEQRRAEFIACVRSLVWK